MSRFRVALVLCGFATLASNAFAQTGPYLHDDLSGTLKNQLIVKSEGAGASFTFDIDYEYKASLLMGEPVVTCSAQIRNPDGHVSFEYDGQLRTIEINEENAKLLTPYNIDYAITYKSVHSDNAYFLARCNTGIPGSWAQQALNVPFSPDWDDFLCWAAGSRFTTPASTPNILGDDWCKTLAQGGGKLRDEEETKKRFEVTPASDGGPVTRAIEVDVASFAINYNDLIFAEIKKLSAQKIAQRKFDQARQIRNSLHHSGAASTEAAQLLDHAESEAAMVSDPREQARILQGAMRDVLDIKPTQEDAKLFSGTRALIVSLLSSDEERSFIAGIKDDLAGLQDVIDQSTSNVNAYFDQQRTAAANAPQFAFARLEQASLTGPAEISREILRLSGHTQPVWHVSFHPDGKRIVTSAGDNTIRIWDRNSGKELQRLGPFESVITSMVLSLDGRWIIGGGLNQAVSIWDVDTGQLVRQIDGYKYTVTSVAISPDGRYLLAGDGAQMLLRDFESGSVLRELTERGRGFRVGTFGLNSDIVILVGRESIQWHNIDTGQTTEKSAAELWNIIADPFVSEDHLNASNPERANAMATRDGGIDLFTSNGRGLFSPHSTPDETRSIAPSGDGRYIVVGDRHGYVSVIDRTTDEARRLDGRHDEMRSDLRAKYYLEKTPASVLAVAFSADGRLAASGGADGTVRIWGPAP